MSKISISEEEFAKLSLPILSCPFGDKARNNSLYNNITRDIPGSESDTVLNLEKGIPPRFAKKVEVTDDKSAAINNGLWIKRADINGLGRLMTELVHYMQHGKLNEHKNTFSYLQGGYAAGAILDYWDGSWWYKILSLVDNNIVKPTDKVLAAEKYWRYVTPQESSVVELVASEEVSSIANEIKTGNAGQVVEVTVPDTEVVTQDGVEVTIEPIYVVHVICGGHNSYVKLVSVDGTESQQGKTQTLVNMNIILTKGQKLRSYFHCSNWNGGSPVNIMAIRKYDSAIYEPASS